MYRELITVTVCSLGIVACGGQKKFEVSNPFPSQKEMAKLAAAPVDAEAVERPEVTVVDTWELAGPLPDTIGFSPYVPENPTEKTFYSSLSSEEGRVTSTAMHCAAREAGRFVLEHGSLPYASLDNFIFARCGVTTAGNSLRWRPMTNADAAGRERGASEAASWFDGYAGKLEKDVDVGFWSGSKGDETIFIVALGQRQVELEPTPMRPDAQGKLVIQGRVLDEDYDHIGAAINQGDFGYQSCTVDPRVSLPRFRVVCQAQQSDELAYFGLMIRRETSVMAESALLQLTWPAAEPSKLYRSPATRRALSKAQARQAQAATAGQGAGQPASADSDGQTDQQEVGAQADVQPDVQPAPLVEGSVADAGATYSERFVALLNAVRAKAGLDPVEVAPRQAAAIQSVSEQLVAAQHNGDEAYSNTAVMGIIAGWEIQGPIVDGDISISWVGSQDPAQMLEAMLERPGPRETLMAPEITKVALGVVANESSTCSIVASYDFLPDVHPNKRAKQVLDSLSEKRDMFGSRPAKEDPKLRAKARKLSRKLAAGQIGILDAHDELGEAATRRWNKSVYSYTMVSPTLEGIDWPRELLASKNLPVSVIVAPYQHEGYPWTLYAIIVVYPEQPRANVAQLFTDSKGPATR